MSNGRTSVREMYFIVLHFTLLLANPIAESYTHLTRLIIDMYIFVIFTYCQFWKLYIYFSMVKYVPFEEWELLFLLGQLSGFAHHYINATSDLINYNHNYVNLKDVTHSNYHFSAPIVVTLYLGQIIN